MPLRRRQVQGAATERANARRLAPRRRSGRRAARSEGARLSPNSGPSAFCRRHPGRGPRRARAAGRPMKPCRPGTCRWGSPMGMAAEEGVAEVRMGRPPRRPPNGGTFGGGASCTVWPRRAMTVPSGSPRGVGPLCAWRGADAAQDRQACRESRDGFVTWCTERFARDAQ